MNEAKVRKDKVTEGGRIYNGLPSKLMNDLYDYLIARDENLTKHAWWPVFSLYLARSCGVVEAKNLASLKELHDNYNPDGFQYEVNHGNISQEEADKEIAIQKRWNDALQVLSEYQELQTENLNLKKRVGKAEGIGLCDEALLSSKYEIIKDLQAQLEETKKNFDDLCKRHASAMAEIAELKHDKQAVEDAVEQAGLELHQLKLDYTKLETQLKEMKSSLPTKEEISYLIEGNKEIDEVMSRNYEYEDRRETYLEVAQAISDRLNIRSDW